MARSPILVAAQVGLYVNGAPYGRVSDFVFGSDTTNRHIDAVDAMETFELAPTTVRISGAMSVYRLSQDGGVEGAGMIPPISELTRQKYFKLLLIDLTSGSVLFQANQCSVESQSWKVSAGQRITGSISWSAITWNNEVRPVG